MQTQGSVLEPAGFVLSRTPVLCRSTSLCCVGSQIKNKKLSMLLLTKLRFLSHGGGSRLGKRRDDHWKTSKMHWIRQANCVGQPAKSEINRKP